MSKQKLIAALPLAAVFATLCHMPPASAAGQDQGQDQDQGQGMVVVRDHQTGQLRPPTAAELKALRPQPGTSLWQPKQPGQPGVVLHPDGSRHVRVGEKGMVYSVVTRDSEGKLVNQCVQGEAAAEAALKPAQHDKEHSDESR